MSFGTAKKRLLLIHSYSFLEMNKNEKLLAIDKSFSPDLELVCTYKTRKHFEAMQAYYDYMDFGQYKPEPDWENIVYDELE